MSTTNKTEKASATPDKNALQANPADHLPPFVHTVHDVNCECQPPKLRPGEHTGELFQDKNQPFNLAGEKVTFESIIWPSEVDRAELRAKQDRIIQIATRRNMPSDVPISDIQHGAPTIDDLRSSIYPDFMPSINAFLKEFDREGEFKFPAFGHDYIR